MAIISSLPFTLLNGQTADATQVMANFNTIVSNVNASAAANGDNSDITALLGLLTPLAVFEGGTGATTFAGAGLVIGPALAVAGQVAGFADVTGKVLAALYTVGILANNLVQLNASAQIPALDGSLLIDLVAAAVNYNNATSGLAATQVQAAIDELAKDLKGFTSAQQGITSGGQLVIPHGLGIVPRYVTFTAVCQTGEFGYSAGDILVMNPGVASVAGINSVGMSAVIDATNVTIRFGNNASAFNIIDKGSGVGQSMTNANWKLVVGAMI